MNRRLFLAASLPALLEAAALRASAQAKPAPKRIRIEVSLQKPGLALGMTNAQIVVLSTEEGVATDAEFLQMYTFHENKDAGTVSSQAYGPKLNVTAHIESDGRIHLTGRVEFEEATASAAAPDQPLPIRTNSLALNRTVTSGQAVTLGGLVVGRAAQTIQLTATVIG